MIATMSGRPRAPARTNDDGVPPTPTQHRQRVLHRPRVDRLPVSAGGAGPDQWTSGLARTCSSSSSFSSNSSS
jgi:hypothetical protein